jgi:type VI secretion system protein ImpK
MSRRTIEAMGRAVDVGMRGVDDLEATLMRPHADWVGAGARAAGVPAAIPAAIPVEVPVEVPAARRPQARTQTPPSASAPAEGELFDSQIEDAPREPPAFDDEPWRAAGRASVGRHALVAAAAPLLNAALRLREGEGEGEGATRPDAARVRSGLLDALLRFERQAVAQGVPHAHRLAARYVICTWLDETVARTRWGAAAGWPRQGLLVTLHRDNVGGERFFAIADQVMRDPARHVDLIDLLAVMLDLGFEGRYALEPDGRQQLDAWRARLHAAARRARPDDVSPLPSPAPRGRIARRRAGPRPGAIAALAVGALVVAAAFAEHHALARRQEAALRPLLALLDGLHAPPLPAASPPRVPALPAALPRLRPLLRAEIEAGLLDVEEGNGRARITLVGDRFYEPGAVEIRADHRAVLARVALALEALPGFVTVAGHTDDRPMRANAPYATNAALSLERARRVASLLSLSLADASRLRVEGWADQRPRASNGSDDGRARNRRVEIGWQAPVAFRTDTDDDAAPR